MPPLCPETSVSRTANVGTVGKTFAAYILHFFLQVLLISKSLLLIAVGVLCLCIIIYMYNQNIQASILFMCSEEYL